MNAARIILALSFVLLMSVLGVAEFQASLSHFVHRYITTGDPLTPLQLIAVEFVGYAVNILLSGLLGTLIAGPIRFKRSAAWTICLSTFMAILMGVPLIGVSANGGADLTVGARVVATIGFIAIAAITYLGVCHLCGYIHRYRNEASVR